MDITGRIFDIHIINDKVVQLVLKKRVQGKTTPIAFTLLGYWADVALNTLKLKKNDKITGVVVLKSKLYNGKYYTDVYMKNIELLPEKEKEKKNDSQLELIEEIHIVDESTGEILL